MAELIGLDGKPLDDAVAGELVTADGYMEHLGRRTGMSYQQREFLRKNLPSAMDGPPQHMSRSQRQIAALQQSAMTLSIQNLQLWGLLGAFAQRAGGEAKFTRPELDAFSKPEAWPVVVLEDDEDGGNPVVVVKLGQFAGVASDKVKVDIGGDGPPPLSAPFETPA